MKNFKNHFLLFSPFLIILLAGIDLITKEYAFSVLEKTGRYPIISGVFEFAIVKNTGAAFSFLTGHQWVFIVLIPLIMAFVIYFLSKIPEDNKFFPLKVICIFILSGAIGNYMDRLLLGYVRDFIYFSLINFPVFNVADIYVTCSVITMFILFVFYYKEDDLKRLF